MVNIAGKDIDFLTLVAGTLGVKVAYDEYKDATPEVQEKLKWGAASAIVAGALGGVYGPSVKEHAKDFLKDPQYESIRKTIEAGVVGGVGTAGVYSLLKNPISKMANTYKNANATNATTQNNP